MDFLISYTTIWKLNIKNPGKGRGSHHVFRHKLPLLKRKEVRWQRYNKIILNRDCMVGFLL